MEGLAHDLERKIIEAASTSGTETLKNSTSVEDRSSKRPRIDCERTVYGPYDSEDLLSEVYLAQALALSLEVHTASSPMLSSSSVVWMTEEGRHAARSSSYGRHREKKLIAASRQYLSKARESILRKPSKKEDTDPYTDRMARLAAVSSLCRLLHGDYSPDRHRGGDGAPGGMYGSISETLHGHREIRALIQATSSQPKGEPKEGSDKADTALKLPPWLEGVEPGLFGCYLGLHGRCAIHLTSP